MVVLVQVSSDPEGMQSEIGEFQYEAGIHQAVRGLEVAVGPDFRIVQVNHPLLVKKKENWGAALARG